LTARCGADDEQEDVESASDLTTRLFRMAKRGGSAYDGEEEEEETEDDKELDASIGEAPKVNIPSLMVL
jgi:hypothetical protein